MAEINMSTVAYILGLLSIVLAFFSPIAGFIFGIIGFVQSKKQKSSKAKRLNVIGIVLCIIFLIIDILLLIYTAGTGLLSFGGI